MTDVTTTTETLGMRDTLIKHIVCYLVDNTESENEALVHAAVVYQIMEELCGLTSRDELFDQLKGVSGRIIKKVMK